MFPDIVIELDLITPQNLVSDAFPKKIIFYNINPPFETVVVFPTLQSTIGKCDVDISYRARECSKATYFHFVPLIEMEFFLFQLSLGCTIGKFFNRCDAVDVLISWNLSEKTIGAFNYESLHYLQWFFKDVVQVSSWSPKAKRLIKKKKCNLCH